ncbi:hypothetical protein NEOLEDRAFT_524277 [Neolentinus lepideus HHB14362 ss-1]|uniref:Uncharacterized protein n=1 Tax=Neolentinus lepideus HHB14362 ss-1 TaxID=1314782 RepID=A0A165RCZ2_9AGAM|nr:hypothetical protein NEOLEDRAFT_524277 [Neolentinus lepideus HHB14362 ss-1]
MIVGRASGKRTLVEVMDLEMEVNRKRKRDEDFISDISATETKTLSSRSRFFERSASAGWPPEGTAVAGPSRLTYEREQKENIPILVDSEEYASDGEFSIAEECGDLEEDGQEVRNVAQEDGYLSPTHSIRWDTPDLSSPPKRSPAGNKRSDADVDFFGADAISSPITGHSHSTPRRHGPPSQDVTILKRTLSSTSLSDSEEAIFEGVDLRDAFGDDEGNLTSDVEPEDIYPENSFSSATSTSTSGPVTPDDSGVLLSGGDDIQLDLDFDIEEEAEKQIRVKQEIVARGWRQQWACATASTKRLDKQQVRCFRARVDLLTYQSRRRLRN